MASPTLTTIPNELLDMILVYVTGYASPQNIADLGSLHSVSRRLWEKVTPLWLPYLTIDLAHRSGMHFFRKMLLSEDLAPRVTAICLSALYRAPAVGTRPEWEQILLLCPALQWDYDRRQGLARRLGDPADDAVSGQDRAEALLLLAFKSLPKCRHLSLVAAGNFPATFRDGLRDIRPVAPITSIHIGPGGDPAWIPLVIDDFWVILQLPQLSHITIDRLTLRCIDRGLSELSPITSLNVFSRNGHVCLPRMLTKWGRTLTSAILRSHDRTCENWHALVEGLRHHSATLVELRLSSREELESYQLPHQFAPADPAWATSFTAVTVLEVPAVAIDARFANRFLGALLPPCLEYLSIFCPASDWAPDLRVSAATGSYPSTLRQVDVRCRYVEDAISYDVLATVFDHAEIVLRVIVRDW